MYRLVKKEKWLKRLTAHLCIVSPSLAEMSAWTVRSTGRQPRERKELVLKCTFCVPIKRNGFELNKERDTELTLHLNKIKKRLKERTVYMKQNN